MTPKTQNNTIKIATFIITVSIAAGGIFLAIGGQKEKLQTVSSEQKVIKDKVDRHEIEITVLKSDIKYIKKGIDDIKDEIKK